VVVRVGRVYYDVAKKTETNTVNSSKNLLFNDRANAAGALVNPNGVTGHSYWPNGVVKAVLGHPGSHLCAAGSSCWQSSGCLNVDNQCIVFFHHTSFNQQARGRKRRRTWPNQFVVQELLELSFELLLVRKIHSVRSLRSWLRSRLQVYSEIRFSPRG